MRLNPQKLQGHCAFCVSMVLRSPFRAKCVLIAKTEVKLRFFAFGRFCVDGPCANCVDFVSARATLYCSTSVIKICLELTTLHLLAEPFRGTWVPAVANHVRVCLRKNVRM